jgi:amino acid transporter
LSKKNMLHVSVQSGERKGLMANLQPTPGSGSTLERRIGLRSAVLFNMLEMIGVGPFITLPLVIAAAGFRLSVWAWVLGAVIAVADGLVWAELGAAFPRAGGSYAFLREIYGPKGAGNWLGFLYVWQLSFSAPLSIASGCIGLASFLAWFWPGLEQAPIAALPALHYANFAAVGACLLVTALLYRNLSQVTRLAWILFVGVMAAIAGVIVSGFSHASAMGGWAMPVGPTLGVGLALGGLAQATLITTYDYWGYYNITFLGSEVKRPERTIPRAILLSVLFVSAFYVAMNLAALPSMRDAGANLATGATLRLQLVAQIAQSAFGLWAGRLMAALIVWTAFASVFSLLLGYSRVPYAAARDGNYFRFLAAVHPKHGIPHRSLIALGLVAAVFCFLTLTQVITLLVIARILLQFFLQHAGVILLRIQRPELARPFKMPLYPLPPLIAMAGFVFMLVNRSHALQGLVVAGCIGLSGTAIYLVRAKRLGDWPFANSSTQADVSLDGRDGSRK